MGNANSAIQQAAANGLISIGDAAAEELIVALGHEDSSVRARSAQILGTVGFKPALSSLQALLSDETEVAFGMRVCDFAAEAIDNLG